VFGGLIAVCLILVLFGLTATVPVFMFLFLFLLGFVVQILAAALQIRLMDASPDAPSLASSSNHSSLNVANGAGAWLGGLAIAAGWGYTSTAWVGVGLSLAGLAIAAASMLYERRAFKREITNQTMAMASAASTAVETGPR
jgi:DHA1 family inner membrane transport protein